jgi:hypothetical protein
MKAIIFGVCVLLLVASILFSFVSYINFNRYAGGYLERAAHANTVQLADQELSRALIYVEAENLTEGYTSIFYRTPDEDIGFWYQNLKASLADLRALSADSSPLEQSNMLMKLRETLIEQREKSAHVRSPDGIGVYPHNKLVAIVGFLSLIVGLAVFIYADVEGWS